MSNRKMKVMMDGSPRQNSRKLQRSGRRTVATESREKILELTLIKSYPRQICWDVWLPLLPSKATTTVTTGLVALSYQVTQAAIGAFATKFGSTFLEMRFIKAIMKVRMFGSTNPGVIQMWYDEKSNAVPTLVEAQQRYILSENASSVDVQHTLKWTNADTLDLQYTPIGTTVNPVTFKTYTNNANFGSSIVATDYFEIEGAARIQFRGLQGS